MNTPNTAANGGQILTDERIADLYREAFNGMADRLRDAPEQVPPTVIAFGRSIEADLHASFAAVPASEPVHFVKSMIHPNGWHECTFADLEGHMRAGFATRTLYAAAPAPVSGMPTEWRIDNKLSNGDVFSVYLKEQPTEAMLVEGATVTPLGPVAPVSGMPDLAGLSDTDILEIAAQHEHGWASGGGIAPYSPEEDEGRLFVNLVRAVVAAIPSPQAPDTPNPTGETK